MPNVLACQKAGSFLNARYICVVHENLFLLCNYRNDLQYRIVFYIGVKRVKKKQFSMYWLFNRSQK